MINSQFLAVKHCKFTNPSPFTQRLLTLERENMKTAQVQNVSHIHKKQIQDTRQNILIMYFKSKSVTEQQKSCRRKSCPGIMNDSYEPDFSNFRPPGFDELKNPNIATESPQTSSGRTSDAYVEVCSEVGGDNSPKSALRNFLTIVALSLHCVFEGIGIGLQDTLDGLWIMFAGKNVI